MNMETNLTNNITLATLNCKYNNVDEHIRKVRRRIEDYLRKSPKEEIIEIAEYLNINTD